MAKILKSESAPSGAIKFLLAQEEFDLNGGTFETDDAAVVNEAFNHPWLKAEVSAVIDNPDTYREDDPQDNPSIDIHSGKASPEAIEAAKTKDEEIKHRFDNAEDVARFGGKTPEPVTPEPPVVEDEDGGDTF